MAGSENVKSVVKVGDKVKSLVTQLDVREGATYEVKTVDFDGDIWVTDDVGDRFYLTTDEFELLPDAAATGKPAFKVGDRVVALKDSAYSIKKGSISTVVRVDGDYISIRKENGTFDGWRAEYFALALFTIETGKFYRTRDGRKVGPMSDEGDRAYDTDEKCLAAYINGDHRLFRAKDGRHLFGKAHLDLIAEWVDAPASNDNRPATQPAIVALIEGGQPKPSEKPKVHKSEVSATDEAERLAVKYPGQKFGVFVLADSRIADVVIRRAA
ncbi:hypothetical protein F9K88_07650 [Brucella intermedia]|uniref:hypothetical protein n=1 Tax=Brucella intermedia TaxID=94625 RepID=UPI00124C4B05|nr:hypothetical protein [Brucella intermedia]KAB2712823.1 hypothetical protein F9K88_07650 [Brucella intermedia]